MTKNHIVTLDFEKEKKMVTLLERFSTLFRMDPFGAAHDPSLKSATHILQ